MLSGSLLSLGLAATAAAALASSVEPFVNTTVKVVACSPERIERLPPWGKGLPNFARFRYYPSAGVEERQHVSRHAGEGCIEPGAVPPAHGVGVRAGRAVTRL